MGGGGDGKGEGRPTLLLAQLRAQDPLLGAHETCAKFILPGHIHDSAHNYRPPHLLWGPQKDSAGEG